MRQRLFDLFKIIGTSILLGVMFSFLVVGVTSIFVHYGLLAGFVVLIILGGITIYFFEDML